MFSKLPCTGVNQIQAILEDEGCSKQTLKGIAGTLLSLYGLRCSLNPPVSRCTNPTENHEMTALCHVNDLQQIRDRS